MPCARCGKGTLNLDKDSLSVKEPKFSSDAHSHDAWHPDWDVERFTAMMVCSNNACGEISAIAGDTYVTEVLDDEVGWAFESFLRPKMIFPAPQIIDIPKEVSPDIRNIVQLSFELYWSDLNSCANRLRASVEKILTDLKIPTEGKTKNGKPYRLDLSARIAAYKKVHSDHAETMDALRHVGNIGSHDDNINREVILDAFHIYEDTLSELYGKRSATIKAIRAKIMSTKGKYK
jgi:hypothetical protein